MLGRLPVAGRQENNPVVVRLVAELLINMGKAVHARRWSREFKTFLALVSIKGGPACAEFVSANFYGPSWSTTKRALKKYKYKLEPGISQRNCLAAVEYFTRILRATKGRTCFMVAIDDTVTLPLMAVVTLDEPLRQAGMSAYALRATCGKRGDGHVCQCVDIHLPICPEERFRGRSAPRRHVKRCPILRPGCP